MRGKEDEIMQFFRPSSLGLASSEAFLEEIELLLCVNCQRVYHPIFSRGSESAEQCDEHKVIVLYPQLEEIFFGEGGEKIFPAKTETGKIFIVSCLGDKYTLLPFTH